jgi:hypothetical protein
MKTTKSILAAGLLLGALLAPAGAQETLKKTRPEPRIIDLAVCLDASGSMDGLINSARQRIWAIVNDLATAKPTPRLRVALLIYGNDGNNPAAGWVKVLTNLTEDLDLVSQQLFSITTNGGTELVARVIQTSLQTLPWNNDPGSLKLIVVAGNESADQDKQVSFRDQCKKAIASGIMINSIYCVWGKDTGAIVEEWKDVARLSDGHYATIDQNRGTITVATPFDNRLDELSRSLNATYVPFGPQGKAGWTNQQRQDANAAGLAADAAAQRATAKSGKLYYCRWCLVDATRNKAVKLAEVEEKDLPEKMRSMTLEERQKHLDGKWAKRQEIQKQVNEMSKKRRAFVTEEMKRQSFDESKAFDVAVRKAIRAQAEKKGYAFEDQG